MKLFLLVLFFSCIAALPGYSTDHKDGPHTTEFKYADILDLFAFVRRDNADPNIEPRLVLIMTAYPKAQKDTYFSEDVQYKFRIKELSLTKSGGALAVEPDDGEDTVVCGAKPVDDHGKQNFYCELTTGSCAEGGCRTDVEITPSSKMLGMTDTKKGGMLSVFAGLVQDPFFSAVFNARRKHNRKETIPTTGDSLLDYQPFKNSAALGVVVELNLSDLAVLRENGGYLGVVGESWVNSHHSNELTRRDRAGRVEVTNFIMCFRPIGGDFVEWVMRLYWTDLMDLTCSAEDAKFKDDYNREDAFAVSETTTEKYGVYERLFRQGLRVLDSIDSGSNGPLDWDVHAKENELGGHALLNTLLDHDYLIIDPSKTCGTQPGFRSYLDIEMSKLRDVPGGHTTCGGRVPNDDVVDTTITVFSNGPDRLPSNWWPVRKDNDPKDVDRTKLQRTDGVTQAGKKAPGCFPWLAPFLTDVTCSP